MKKVAFVLYGWTSTVFYVIALLWLATVPNLLDGTDDVLSEVLKVTYRFVLYSLLLILIYRSLIFTFKNLISRLSSWKSKREEIEDAEFVLVVETLLMIIAILASILIAAFQEYLQFALQVESSNSEVRDVLISIMSIILTSIVVYSTPSLGELEVLLKEKTLDLANRFRK